MNKQKFHAKTQLKNFKKLFILGGVVIFLSILVLAFISSPKEEKKSEKVTTSDTFTAVKPISVSPADIMSQRLEQFTLDQQKINEQNVKRITDLEAQNLAYQKEVEKSESEAAAINDKLAKLNTTKSNASGVATVSKPQKLVFEDDINNDTSDSFEIASKKQANPTEHEAETEKNTDKSVATYIPSNTFVKGILIGSLSANTGGNASSDPTPVLIRLTNLAQLPNEFKSNLKSCMVGGSGWGDLSTERVKVRLTTLSCVLKSGKAIDIPVDGYIDGEDAKAGIKGVVVSHSGTIAAKAALAGFLQGMGQIGQAMGQTQTITPLGGVTTTVSPTQALYAGGGAGVYQAGMNLSQYYMNMLTQISPAIEVAAGRHITVIFIKGIELKLPINEDTDDSTIPLPID